MNGFTRTTPTEYDRDHFQHTAPPTRCSKCDQIKDIITNLNGKPLCVSCNEKRSAKNVD